MEQKIHLYQMFNHAAQVCKNEEEKNESKPATGESEAEAEPQN